MDWRAWHQSRLIPVDEAAGMVKSGSSVTVTAPEPVGLCLALAARKEELEGVKIFISGGGDLGWYDAGWEDSFNIRLFFVLPVTQLMMKERRGDFLIGGIVVFHDPSLTETDILFTQISIPDEHGFCSFGSSLWNKKTLVRAARVAIAEINPKLIRTYGDNIIHVSEIDYFVEHTPGGKVPGATDMLGRKTSGPSEVERKMAEYVGTLIKDGDTLEMGVGGGTEWIPQLGILNNKHDLGWHSENTPRGIPTLVREGVINGKKKTLHQGKAVATAVGGGTQEELDFINMNPLFEVYDSDYVLNPGVIGANDNMVVINSALSIDLTGQVNAESLGPTMFSGAGGQLGWVVGASLSKGGRSIHALPSTVLGGTRSRIVAQLELGSVVTIPRTLVDYVVTEYGIARLKGKTQRES